MKFKAWVVYNSNDNRVVATFDTLANAVGYIQANLMLSRKGAREVGYHIRRATISFKGVRYAKR